MANLTLPPQDYLRQCFDLFSSELAQHSFNVQFSGRPAGNRIKSSGRWKVKITYDGISADYLQHRVIWKFTYGTEPDRIDHENIDGGDNRVRNLRPCEHYENMSNTRIRPDNTTGFRGVSLMSHGRFRAMINHKGKRLHLGCFETKEAAAAAYAAKSAELHGAFAGQLEA